jgi:hypothetical protein
MSDCAAPTPDSRYRLDDQRPLRGDARWEIEIIDPKAIALREKKRTVVSAWASAKATAVKNSEHRAEAAASQSRAGLLRVIRVISSAKSA